MKTKYKSTAFVILSIVLLSSLVFLVGCGCQAEYVICKARKTGHACIPIESKRHFLDSWQYCIRYSIEEQCREDAACVWETAAAAEVQWNFYKTKYEFDTSMTIDEYCNMCMATPTPTPTPFPEE